MKVALVHDQLAEFGGAERVLISLKKAYPDADVYVSFIDRKRLGIHAAEFAGWKIYESRARYIPFFSRLYSPFRFLLPWIWRSFDLSSYDLVICSSSWGMCKGVSLVKSKSKNQNSKEQKILVSTQLSTTNPQASTRFICYLHTPPRYLYGYDESALKRYTVVKIYAAIVNHFLRFYDYASSQSVDEFIFNSEEIRQRSLKFYRRDGIVIHPPIQAPSCKLQAASNNEAPNSKFKVLHHNQASNTNDQDREQVQKSQLPDVGEEQNESHGHKKDIGHFVGNLKSDVGNYFLTVSRLAPTKHIDVLIHAANTLKIPFKIVGIGKEEAYLRSIAGPTIEFCGSVPDETLHSLYAGARAFLYASVNEDFGMVPVEAMSYGIPVIAYASGGVKETVTLQRGILYHELTSSTVSEAIRQFETLSIDAKTEMGECARAYARALNETYFISAIRAYLYTN